MTYLKYFEVNQLFNISLLLTDYLKDPAESYFVS